jgi:glycerate 2-kinase
VPAPAPLEAGVNPEIRKLLRQLLDAGLGQVSGHACVVRALQESPIAGAVHVLAVGKAADGMMRGARSVLGGQYAGGLLIPRADTRLAPLEPGPGLRICPAGHPVPDQSSLDAGQAMIEFVAAVPPQDTLLVLVSGGASSLAEVPVEGVGLEELARLNRYLLGAGLDIGRCNALRRRLSRIKAGGLLDFVGTDQVLGLLISDVPGDDPAVIGSGLLTPGPLRRLPAGLPADIRELFGRRQPQPARRPTARVRVIGSNARAREAIARRAGELGLRVRQANGVLEGDAARCGRRIASFLVTAGPGLYLWGGETTVTLPPKPGLGGRNQHLALAAAMVLEGRQQVHLLACGSDGNDGPGSWAGALVDGSTLAAGRARGMDPAYCLERADAGSFLRASGDLVHTGPTGTNVADLVLGLVSAQDRQLR